MSDVDGRIPESQRYEWVAALRASLAALERALLDSNRAAARAHAGHLSADALAVRASLTPQPNGESPVTT